MADWEARFGRPEPGVVCVGMNYAEHVREQGGELPPAPLLFAKLANTLCSSGETIVLPPGIGHVDAEAELAIVIGTTAHEVAAGEAMSYVAGFTCANDVSARDIQFSESQWFRGKGYDTFCPVGPTVVAASELGDPGNLRISQRVNGEILQDSSTSDLIFGVPELVAYVSAFMTLRPGDLILTGTPQGVGVFREPKRPLRDGDLVEVEIEGIGVLRNDVRAE
jgi:2-keto-4-pentenoate hydratase/2-oxohepta-3-ene-1,7-dioic acid hydratase in catechol pathway